MAKTREQKGKILEELKDKIGRAKSIFFTKFDRLTVAENENLRDELAKEQSEYYVAKKTLLEIAFKGSEVPGLAVRKLDGRLAAIFNFGDEATPAKVLGKFMKDHPLEISGEKTGASKLEFLGGILEGKFISAREATALTVLPSRLELYGKIVGSLNAPLAGLVNVLAGNLRGLVYVLKALEEKKA